MTSRQVVLLVHHGTVGRAEDIPAFLKNVRRGREAPPELIAEIRHRYEKIGWSPLETIAGRLASKLEARLGVPVRTAGRLWHPYPREVVEPGTERVAVVPLAQHSARVYADAVRRDLPGVNVVSADDWGQTPALLDAFATRARAKASKAAALVLTAHSLPKGVDDAYEQAVRESARGIVERLDGLFAETHVAFQSQGAGADPETWLGPSLPEVLGAVKSRRVVIAPVGFLIDHVEILYDLDIEARALAKARDIDLDRTESLNDSDDFVGILETLARGVLA